MDFLKKILILILLNLGNSKILSFGEISYRKPNIAWIAEHATGTPELYKILKRCPTSKEELEYVNPIIRERFYYWLKKTGHPEPNLYYVINQPGQSCLNRVVGGVKFFAIDQDSFNKRNYGAQQGTILHEIGHENHLRSKPIEIIKKIKDISPKKYYEISRQQEREADETVCKYIGCRKCLFDYADWRLYRDGPKDNRLKDWKKLPLAALNALINQETEKSESNVDSSHPTAEERALRMIRCLKLNYPDKYDLCSYHALQKLKELESKLKVA